MSIDLPDATNCTDVDHIVIYSIIRPIGNNSTYKEVRTVCGQSIPDSFSIFGSNILIRFITKSANGLYAGFHLKFESSSRACGDTIVASTGVIESPKDLSTSTSTWQYCQWLITVPKGRRVKIEVLDYDVGPDLQHNNLNLQKEIVFYNDFALNNIIALYSSLNVSSSSEPWSIYSSDNEMGVLSFLLYDVNYRGFKLRFTSNEPTICIGNLDDNEGVFETPTNQTKFVCNFQRVAHKPFIESQSNVGTLSIHVNQEPIFSNFTQCISDLPTGITVDFDPDGDEDEIIYYTKCPPTYKSIVTPNSRIKVKVRDSVYYKYRFPYKIHNCGRHLSGTLQTITIPTFTSNYGELDCAWQYTTNVDHNIQMFVNAPAMNCETEWLTIYRGSSSKRPHAAQICGDATVANRSIVINGQYAYVEFHTDNYSPVTAAALHIEIVTSDGICGGIIDSPNYLFSSPLNGTKYPPNIECEWIIRARNGYHVGLTFVNRFMIEQSPACTKDYIKVFDKVNGEFREMAKICGREFPHQLNSTGQEMKVVFRTDGTGNGDGFTVRWSENCGGVFRASSKLQYITSPHYPEPYPSLAYCNYTILQPLQQHDTDPLQPHINLKFLKFNLEPSVDCRADNVTIYRQHRFRHRLRAIGTYCRNDSVLTFRYRGAIQIIFRSDFYDERTGFEFTFGTDQCGGNITDSTEISSLQNDGNEYFASATCVWLVSAPVDKKIDVRFEFFELEFSVRCVSDYVEVFEGSHAVDGRRRARLCGNLTEHAPSINIDSNTALIRFVADSTVQEKGFRALILFTKNCNEYINLTASNPRFILNKLSNQYEPLLNCEYFITAPKGYVIRSKFNQMHLTPCTTTKTNNNSCTCDYLIVRDGAGPFAESFGTFCGHSTPADMLTTTGSMYMRFVTDNIDFGTGFSAELEIINAPCGQDTFYLNSSSESITISAPMSGHSATGFDFKYISNANCLWKFSVNDEGYIEISFDEFNLEEDPTNKCKADYLEISDGSVRVLGFFC